MTSILLKVNPPKQKDLGSSDIYIYNVILYSHLSPLVREACWRNGTLVEKCH